MNSFLLVYILYNKNIIIDVRPIMDTFIIIDNDNNVFKLIDNN
jgi:hypothetical protein